MTTKKSGKKGERKAPAKKTPEKKVDSGKPEAVSPEKKLSALDAAEKVLSEKGVAMTCQELIGTMAAKGYWSSPGGKTPAATLYSAMMREINTKGNNSRFVRPAPGRFASRDAGIAAEEQPAKPARRKKAGKPPSEAQEPTPSAAASDTSGPDTAA
jgi:hypothetical protein